LLSALVSVLTAARRHAGGAEAKTVDERSEKTVRRVAVGVSASILFFVGPAVGYYAVLVKCFEEAHVLIELVWKECQLKCTTW